MRQRVPDSSMSLFSAGQQHPDFAPTLDRTRPHELLQHSALCGSFRYRYTDNGQEVLVPSAWFNRPTHWRLEGQQQQSEDLEERLTHARKGLTLLQDELAEGKKTLHGKPLPVLIKAALSQVESLANGLAASRRAEAQLESELQSEREMAPERSGQGERA